MISKLEVSAAGIELTDELSKYIDNKIGRLDRYMNRHAKRTIHAEVNLKAELSKSNDKYTAEVILHLPGGKLTAKDATLSMFAAIDIVEAKLQNQLRKYHSKTKHRRSDRKGVLARFRQLADRDFRGRQN